MIQFFRDLRHVPAALRQFAKRKEAAQAYRADAIANGPQTIAEAMEYPRVGRRLYPEHIEQLVPTSPEDEKALDWLRSITQPEATS